MEWLGPENLLAVLGVLSTVGVLAYERLMPGLKRIGYRVQMDTVIGSDARNGRADVRLGLFRDTPGMRNGTLVLLRIENDGLRGISADDYTSRELTGLTATFTDRTVTGVAVTEPSSDHLLTHFTPGGALRHDGNVVHIPKVPLNRGEHYKLLVLLGGAGAGRDVTVDGGLKEGAVKRNRQQPRPSNRVLGLIAFLALLLALEPLALNLGSRSRMGCGEGTLTVSGSTVFQPVLKDARRAYEAECEGARVELRTAGSLAGIRTLERSGKESTDTAASHIALSDGPKPGSSTRLTEHRVALVVFTLVVHEKTGVDDLSLDDVRRLYRGEVRNWKQLGGHDLPVRLVSRSGDSGSREVFQQRVLKSGEPALTSQDCVTPAFGQAPVVRCELDTNERVLDKVAQLPGAIGYSDLKSAERHQDLTRLRLDGLAASAGHAEGGGGRSDYPYRDIEYAYSYGHPPAGSPAAGFLDYLVTGGGKYTVRRHGHFPCAVSPNQPLCSAG